MAKEMTPFIARRPVHISEQAKSDRATVKTALISDSCPICRGLRRILQGTRFNVVEEGPVQAREGFPVSEADLFIVDANPPSNRVLEVVKRARQECPNAKIAVLGDQFDLSFVRMGHEAGVDVFGLAGSGREVLINLLELTLLGERVLPRTVLQSLLPQVMHSPGGQMLSASAQTKSDARTHNFSPRETMILKSLIGGETNKGIARKLDITEATIKMHVQSVLRKIGATNRTQAAVWANENLRLKIGPN